MFCHLMSSDLAATTPPSWLQFGQWLFKTFAKAPTKSQLFSLKLHYTFDWDCTGRMKTPFGRQRCDLCSLSMDLPVIRVPPVLRQAADSEQDQPCNRQRRRYQRRDTVTWAWRRVHLSPWVTWQWHFYTVKDVSKCLIRRNNDHWPCGGAINITIRCMKVLKYRVESTLLLNDIMDEIVNGRKTFFLILGPER